MANRPLIAATRDETSYPLNVIDGSIPTDWYGHLFINSPVGTVSSGGLPYPPGSPEEGSPVMNGDGYVFRLDLGPGAINVQTALMKPPCYYADLATKPGNPNGYADMEQFHNLGLTRMSFNLGVRDELNTALTPFRFAADTAPRMLACYDAGRPWEVDTVGLGMVTAIGRNAEYTFATPSDLFAFPVIQTTAHPSFDPATRELFLVNFIHSLPSQSPFTHIAGILQSDVVRCEAFLEKLVTGFDANHPVLHHIATVAGLLFHHVEDHEQAALKWLQATLLAHHVTTNDAAAPPTGANQVYLMRWTGAAGPLDRWQVLDETGQPIDIKQCMHQTTLTEDYIILADASFKVSLDLMFNAPFKSAILNNWLRKTLTMPQLPYLSVYLIKRSDLVPGQTTVTARPVTPNIPHEAVHFSADYQNPGGQITLHLAHNSAACLAEWVRTFDTLAPDGRQAVDPEVIGLISAGCMDIGQIGKVTIDASTGTITQQQYIQQTGNVSDPATIGAHTWGVGLYTYRGILDVEQNTDQIRFNYFSSYGLDPRLLTKFIYDLYFNYSDRVISDEVMVRVTEEGIPFVLSRQNTATMTLEDYYQFSPADILKSVQFVPRTPGAPPVTDDEQKDGYIFTTLLVNYPNADGNNYQCEIWLFRAWDLAAGPCCRLNNPALDYAFTLHTAWTADIGGRNLTYYVDPRADYDPLIAVLEPPARRPAVQQLFDNFVYPAFPSSLPAL